MTGKCEAKVQVGILNRKLDDYVTKIFEQTVKPTSMLYGLSGLNSLTLWGFIHNDLGTALGTDPTPNRRSELIFSIHGEKVHKVN